MTQAQEPLSPVIAEQIHSSFNRQGLFHHLGARMGHVRRGKVHLYLPYSERVSQQHGYFHGGLSSALADTAGGYAAMTMFAPGIEVLTVEYKINFIAPAAGEELEAIGEVIKSGRALSICNLTVISHAGTHTRTVAIGQQTLIKAP